MPARSNSKSGKLFNQQLSLFTQVEKSLYNHRNISAEKRTISACKNRLATLNAHYDNFKTNHALILDEDDKTTQQYTIEDWMNRFEETFIEACSEVEETLNTISAQAEPMPVSGSLPYSQGANNALVNPAEISVSSFPNLAKIQIPTFDGTYTNWFLFNSLFQSMIHENNAIGNIQKFYYLRSSLVGDALKVIGELPLLAENYEEAYKLLCERYENKRVLFSKHMKSFSSLPIIKSEDAASLTHLLNVSKECVCVLKSLGFELKHFEPILVFYLAEKLPHNTREFWVQSSGQKTDISTFKEISDCIEVRIRTIEEMTSNKPQWEKPASIPRPKELTQGLNNAHKTKHPKSFHLKTQSEAKSSIKCSVCEGNHVIRQCAKFLALPVADREQVIQKLNYCYNCFAYNHQIKNCTSPRSCGECGNRHNTLLHNPAIHFSNNQATKQSPLSKVSTSKPDGNDYHHHVNLHVKPTNVVEHEVLLATIIVHLKSADGTVHNIRALLDSGSQATLITEHAAQSRKLFRNPIQANISGLGESALKTARNSTVLTIQSPIDKSFTCCVDAFILPNITSLLPTRQIPFRRWPHLEKLQLADPTYRTPGKIDILLGADAYAQIIMDGLRRGESGEPIAQETRLGWIICGQVNFDNAKTTTISNFFLRSDTDVMIRKFFELESVPEKRNLSPDEKWCELFYNETYRRNADGRFIVHLPFKTYVDKFAVLGRSRDTAIHRQLQLERSFLKNPEFQKKYEEVMAEYIQLGHMHRVSTTEEDHVKHLTRESIAYNCNYIPHHAVMKVESSTTKLRVVYDASRKTSNGKSLNDILFTGPPLQNDIIIVILNWRFHNIAFSADITKMYRQIQLPPADADFQRVVWRNNPNKLMEDYAINTVMFGGSCSPYLAIKTIHQLAFEEQKSFPLAAKVIQTDVYVDDVFSGGDDVRCASNLKRELNGLLKAGGFELRKWVSNSSEILASVPPEDREIQQPLSFNQNETVKALGIYWQPVKDSLSFSIKFDTAHLPTTKRSVLSVIARLYDPSGWIAPLIVVAKIILKQLWQYNLDWDDQIPNELLQDWLNFLDGLNDLPTLQIPRWLNTFSTNLSYQLHAYCDASSNAYAATVYLRTIKADGSVHVALLTAKTKVAPVKPISIPRLELCGALLLVRLLKYIRSGLHLNISDENVFAYTDSQIVLAWLRGDVNRWKIFVANRVSEILETTSAQQWKHIPTSDNPADCATRGMFAKELVCHKLWWQGPTSLMQTEAQWAEENTNFNDIDESEVQAEAKTHHIHTVTVSDRFIERFSSLNKLLRMSVLCFRFAFNARQKKGKSFRIIEPISTEDLQIWTRYWIKAVQAISFPDALNHLKSKKNFSHSKQFLTLNPEMNSDGILVVGGRCQRSNLTRERKHPIILPAHHHFTTLIIRQAHANTLHGGTQVTLTLIRKKYWILDGRNAVRAEINKCVTCYRHNPKPCQQIMGNLPSPRVQFSRPFTHTGVDYAGPISIRPAKGRGITSKKGYICIIICLCRKAIHIKCVSDLSSQSFLAAFNRFVARRGYCSHIYSDNGTNFVGADKILRQNKSNFEKTVQTDLIPTLSNLNITWHFIPPASPNFGGLWEAGVKSIKYHLKRVIGTSTLTFEEITTLLTQIEAVLNSRPLCPLTNDPEDLEPLTPGHFLIGEPLLAPPEPNLIHSVISPLNRFDLIQKMKQGFSKRWKQEYMGRLQSRPKWLKLERNVAVNDLVIVKNDQLPSIQWPLGRIVEVHPGLDNVVRVVTIRTSTGICKRPISKICLLPDYEPIPSTTRYEQTRRFHDR